jgi:transcriptional regulator with XRE-family HTH domain
MQEVHIGEIIRQRFEESGLSKTAFAKKINKSSQNVYTIFKRKSIDTFLLQQIGEALQHDFFQYFYDSPYILQDKEEPYYSIPDRIQHYETRLKKCFEEKSTLLKENNYLNEIVVLLRASLGKA